MRMPIELTPYGVRVPFNQSIEPDAPFIEPSWRNVANYVDHLAFGLWLFELLFDPLQHGPWVSGVS